jgi:hypothetical protein
MYIIGCYSVYVVLSLFVTIWVAHTLHKNGRIFLVEAFHGNEPLADSVNHLLVVGFYLINLGYVALYLRASESVDSVRQSIEMVSNKIGIVLLVLGVMHFFNLVVFSRLRKRSEQDAIPRMPDVWPAPQGPAR